MLSAACCGHDRQERIGGQTGAAHQGAAHAWRSQQCGGVFATDRPAIKNPQLVAGLTESRGQTRTDDGMDRHDIVDRRDTPGADRPDRFIGDRQPALRGRIKIVAFRRGVTVADMLRELLAQEYPEDGETAP